MKREEKRWGGRGGGERRKNWEERLTGIESSPARRKRQSVCANTECGKRLSSFSFPWDRVLRRGRSPLQYSGVTWD